MNSGSSHHVLEMPKCASNTHALPKVSEVYAACVMKFLRVAVLFEKLRRLCLRGFTQGEGASQNTRWYVMVTLEQQHSMTET